MRPILFLSDYGTQDEFVGVCRLVVASIAPGAAVLDLTHGVRGVRWGAAVIEQYLHLFPADAVVLAVVDPGVGTSRRPVVLASGGRLFVGPDNGLFSALDAESAWELSDARFRLEPVSSTFHGRDVFAPAAAHLALGVPPAELGMRLDPGDLVRLPAAHVRARAGELEADVLRHDAFGNVQLAASAADLRAARLGAEVRIDGRQAVVGTTFADAEPGSLVLFVDSAGRVAVAMNLGSAWDELDHPPRVRVVAGRKLAD